VDSDAARHSTQQLGLMPGPHQPAEGGPLSGAIRAAAGGKSSKPAPASPRSTLDDPALASLAEQLQAWERLLLATAGLEDADTSAAAGASKRRSAETGAAPTLIQNPVQMLRASTVVPPAKPIAQLRPASCVSPRFRGAKRTVRHRYRMHMPPETAIVPVMADAIVSQHH